jgi:hypothetical protein
LALGERASGEGETKQDEDEAGRREALFVLRTQWPEHILPPDYSRVECLASKVSVPQ